LREDNPPKSSLSGNLPKSGVFLDPKCWFRTKREIINYYKGKEFKTLSSSGFLNDPREKYREKYIRSVKLMRHTNEKDFIVCEG